MGVTAPEVRYAKSGDVSIAYQVVGEGEHDIVFIPGFVSNVELNWQHPLFAAMFRRLASIGRLIVFDKRGTGLSDRVQGIPPLEVRMDDVRAVMDAAGSERAALVGISEGGPLIFVFAATYPARATAAAVFGTSLGVWTPETPWLATREEALALIPELERRWGTLDYTREFVARRSPSLADDEDYIRWLASYFRASASPGALSQLRRMNADIDIRHVLPAVRVPTLLVHRVDETIPVSNARYIAERVPGARLVELAGGDHAPWYDAAQWIEPVEAFLRDVWAAGESEDEPDRVLATVLFTDICGSTARAAELGDRAWRELLGRHHQVARAQLTRFRGREVDTAGDGFFATFDGPARAIRCARAISEAVRDLGLEIRAGLHTGEVELDDGHVRGIAVHIGARVAAEAGPGEVLVSSTVKDLVAGSGLEFEERGAAELKGVPGEWRLFAVKGD
jgi:class 3 adenylate cyclase